MVNNHLPIYIYIHYPIEGVRDYRRRRERRGGREERKCNIMERERREYREEEEEERRDNDAAITLVKVDKNNNYQLYTNTGTTCTCIYSDE